MKDGGSLKEITSYNNYYEFGSGVTADARPLGIRPPSPRRPPPGSRQPDCRLAPPFLGFTGLAPGLGARARPSMTGPAPFVDSSAFVRLPKIPSRRGVAAPSLAPFLPAPAAAEVDLPVPDDFAGTPFAGTPFAGAPLVGAPFAGAPPLPVPPFADPTLFVTR